MIRIRDNNQLIATVLPTVGNNVNQEQLEQRITRSYNALADIPDTDLEAISNSTNPLNALYLWLDSRRRHAAH